MLNRSQLERFRDDINDHAEGRFQIQQIKNLWYISYDKNKLAQKFTITAALFFEGAEGLVVHVFAPDRVNESITHFFVPFVLHPEQSRNIKNLMTIILQVPETLRSVLEKAVE